MTTRVRTSRMPMPTIVPIWVRAMTGRTPRTVKTAASRMPAEVMTPAGGTECRANGGEVHYGPAPRQGSVFVLTVPVQ